MNRFKTLLTTYPATTSLMGINVFLFAITSLQGLTTRALVNAGAMYAPYVALLHHYWRLVTANFLHASFTHLLMNMIALYVVGTILEPLFGKERFLGIYLLSGIFGTTTSFLFGNINRISVGASGAIFGFFVVVVLLVKLAPYHQGVRALSQQFMGVVLINIAFSFVPGVDLLAHLGGALGGVMAFYIFGYFQHKRTYQISLLIVFGLIILAMIIIGSRGISYGI